MLNRFIFIALNRLGFVTSRTVDGSHFSIGHRIPFTDVWIEAELKKGDFIRFSAEDLKLVECYPYLIVKPLGEFQFNTPFKKISG